MDVSIRIVTDAVEVAFGQSFPLTVVRAWDKDLLPELWSEKALAPLELRAVDTSRREDARHIEETTHFRAYAFSLTDVTVPALSFKATPKDGGVARVASTSEIKLRVRPALDPKAPGPAEFPGDVISEPFPWVRWSAAAVAILAASAWFVRRQLARRRTAAEAPAPAVLAAPTAPAPPAHERALLRLAQMKQRRVDSRAADEAFHVETATVVREYVAERFAFGAPELTSEELLALSRNAPTLTESNRTLLSELLTRCDLVKFACEAPSPAARESLLATAETFVRSTAVGP